MINTIRYLLYLFSNPQRVRELKLPAFEVVIRLIARDNACIYFLREQKVFTTDYSFITKYFDPSKILVLYEPNISDVDPPLPPAFAGKVLLTVSPLEKRYKEFLKTGEMVYMPVYTLDELLSIGAFLRRKISPDDEAQAQLQADVILARYNVFGGIFRHVIRWDGSVTSDDKLAQAKLGFSKLALLKASLVRKPDDNYLASVSHLYLHFFPHYDLQRFDQVVRNNPPETNCDAFQQQFISFSYRLSAQWVCELFHTDITPDEWNAMLYTFNKSFGTYDSDLFELIVGEMLTSRKYSIPLQWTLCSASSNPTWRDVIDQGPFLPLQNKVHCNGNYLRLPDMQPNTLYIPRNSKYPIVDMIFKSSDGAIYGLQVTRADSHSKQLTTYNNFFDKIGLTVESAHLFTFILVTYTANGINNYLKKVHWLDWVTNKTEAKKDPVQTQRIQRIKFGVLVPAGNEGFQPSLSPHALPVTPGGVEQSPDVDFQSTSSPSTSSFSPPSPSSPSSSSVHSPPSSPLSSSSTSLLLQHPKCCKKNCKVKQSTSWETCLVCAKPVCFSHRNNHGCVKNQNTPTKTTHQQHSKSKQKGKKK